MNWYSPPMEGASSVAWTHYSTILATLLIAYILVMRRTLTTAARLHAHVSVRIYTAIWTLVVIVGMATTFLLTADALTGEDVDTLLWVPQTTVWVMLIGILAPYTFAAILFATVDIIAWLTTRRILATLKFAHSRLTRRRITLTQGKREVLVKIRASIAEVEANRRKAQTLVSEMSSTGGPQAAQQQDYQELVKYVSDADQWLKNHRISVDLRTKGKQLGIPEDPLDALDAILDMDDAREATFATLVAERQEVNRELRSLSYKARKGTLMLLAIYLLQDEVNEWNSPPRTNALTPTRNERLRRLKERRKRRRF